MVLIVGSFLALKWLILFPFCWMNHQKSKFSLISYTLSVRGCWGQPKIYYLRIPKLLSNKILLTYFNLSEPIHKIQFNVRYPVCKTIRKFKIFILFEMWVLFCATFWKDQSTKFWINELKSYLPESCSVKQEGLLSFGWVQLQTHQKVLTGNGQLTKVHK